MLGLIEHTIADGIADIETQAGPGLGVVLADMMTNGKKKKKTAGGKGKKGGKKKGGAGKTKGGGSRKVKGDGGEKQGTSRKEKRVS